MADFCFQCNIDLFFGPHSDFKGVCSDGAICNVLCEGCGPVWVNSRGECIDSRCTVHAGDTPPVRPEVYESARRWVARRSGPLGPLLRLRDRVLGSPWEPGEIHFPGTKWHWWYSLYRSLKEGMPLHEYIQPEISVSDLSVFDHPNCRCTIVFSEGFDHYGPSTPGCFGEAPSSAGTEPAGQVDGQPQGTGVLHDEDFGPLQGRTPGPTSSPG